eukprot:12907687-Prorocentrum_lima.AAC.1
MSRRYFAARSPTAPAATGEFKKLPGGEAIWYLHSCLCIWQSDDISRRCYLWLRCRCRLPPPQLRDPRTKS